MQMGALAIRMVAWAARRAAMGLFCLVWSLFPVPMAIWGIQSYFREMLRPVVTAAMAADQAEVPGEQEQEVFLVRRGGRAHRDKHRAAAAAAA